jgi:hypothetical protein
MLKDNLDKLAKAFDTTEDPTLQLKGLSLKRGVEGDIALSFAHGVDFDWEKVNSSHGRTRDEMKSFGEKAKKLVHALVNLISPLAASTKSAAPPPVWKNPLLRRLVRSLSRLLPPRSKMLRWRRLGFLCSFPSCPFECINS